MDAEQIAKAVEFIEADLLRLADERVEAIEKVARATQRVEKAEAEVERIEGMMTVLRKSVARATAAASDGGDG